MAHVLTDDVEIERRPHDDGAVATEHVDDVLRPEMQPAEQFVKIAEADRAGDNAEKATVFAGDAPAEHDRVGAAMQHRPADIQADVGLIAMDLEIVLVAAVFSHRIQCRGVDGQAPVGVEYLDSAEMLRGRGVIEQNQMQQRFGNILEFRHRHVADDGTQRQVVKFDVAADVGVDA